jgi:probable F420-dependent oxidoreductase
MHLAAVLPSNDIANDDAAVKDWAQAVEGLGFDLIIAYDHVLGAEPGGRPAPLAGPYSTEDPFREPLTLFAYLAGVTGSVSFMSGVLVLPQRQTALVAKQAAEVDLVSGGRLVLGVGIGWNYVEYESLGVDFALRGARLEEQIEVLRRLWSDPVVDFHGQFHRIDRAGILPRPARSIPVWFGGRSERAIQRAARIGDGFFFTAVDDDSCRAGEELLALSARSRDTPRASDLPFGLAAQIKSSAGPEKCGADVRRWAAVSGSCIAVDTMTPGATAANARGVLDRHLAGLGECADIVLSAGVPSSAR